MMHRLFALSKYLFLSLLVSVTGLLYCLLALAFFIVFLDPRQQTPDIDYFLLAIGIFGIAIVFLATVSIAGLANRAVNFPLIVLLPSRAEYLTSVLAASLTYGLLIQMLIVVLSLVSGGPSLTVAKMLELVAVWISADVLFSVLALHASDLVANAWSRVYVFGVLAILLYAQSGIGGAGSWLADRAQAVALELGTGGLGTLATAAEGLAAWLRGTGPDAIQNILGMVFWPFRATVDAATTGYFNLSSALAPALFLLYATGLFLLASRYFAYKDLFLSE